MRLFSSRELLHTASRIAIAAAAAGVLAGCSGTNTIADANNDRTMAALEAAQPDTQDFVGGAAYWGARFEANRDDIDAALNFGRNLRMMGGARQAVAVLKDTVMKAPDNARVLSEYGKALTAAGRAKDALPFLSRSAQINGDDWTTLSAYGVALDQSGNHKAARDSYEAALKLSPNNPVVESNIAMSNVLQGRINAAEISLRRLVARPDATAQMRQNLAMVETLKGNLDEAERLAREDLPPSEATNNIAVLRQLDARNAVINVETLEPPKEVPLSAAPPVKADKPADVALAEPAPIAAPQPAAAPAPTPKTPVVYTMAPIADENDKPSTTANTQKATESAATSEAKPEAEQKAPVATNEPAKATGKPTALRQSYDVYRRATPVSVANAAQ
jgi:Flp pilus assembly protein TadD